MINVELVRSGFEAFNRGDVTGVLALLHPDVEVHSVAEVGEEGTYHGHQGFLDWTAIWLDAWDDFKIEVEEIEEVDDENVLIHAHQWGRGKGSGLEVEQRGIYLFTMHEGLATRLHLYADRESALAAARS
jgi:ketosteroid isomerase-like protein